LVKKKSFFRKIIYQKLQQKTEEFCVLNCAPKHHLTMSELIDSNYVAELAKGLNIG